MAAFRIAFLAALIQIGHSNIVNSNEFAIGGNLTVTCSADTIGVDNAATIITNLNLYQNGVEMASAIGLAPQEKIYTSPLFTSWKFNVLATVPTSAEPSNRGTMKITATKTNAQCTEAANYTCSVQYSSAGGIILSKDIVAAVTTRVPPTNFLVTVTPDYQLRTYGFNESVTMDAKVTGDKGYTFYWERQCPNINPQFFEQWPVANEIEKMTTTVASDSTASCLKHDYRQVLTFSTAAQLDGCIVRCILRNYLSQELDSYNKTFTITSSGQETGGEGGGNTAPSSAGPSDDTGMIVGIVVGVLVVIIIVCVLVYFLWYRKRDKSEAYKSDETDNTPETKPPSMHAPPPVFYKGRPTKDEKDNEPNPPEGVTNVALDTSYDSRDSGNRGPPRYVNHNPDGNGPPNYNNDYYQGRGNQGYDDHDDNTSNGGRYSRNRKRSDRLNTSRDSDGQPRSQHSSVDDLRYNMDMGDPNMGTAI